MKIVSRAQWGAREPIAITHVGAHLRLYFVVHHSGKSVDQAVRAIQDWCMDEPPHGRGFSDVDYNHLVRGSTGQIYEGRGWDVVGSHTAGYNTTAVGVCVIGNNELSDAAKASVRWLYEQYNQRAGHELHIRGHRDLATTGTECPGDRIYAWLRAGMPAPEEDEMNRAETIDAVVAALQSVDGKKALQGDVRAELELALDKLGKLQEAVTIVNRRVFALLGTDQVDEPAIIAGVLAGLSPQIIADAIPKELAQRIVDLLVARLQS